MRRMSAPRVLLTLLLSLCLASLAAVPAVADAALPPWLARLDESQACLHKETATVECTHQLLLEQQDYEASLYAQDPVPDGAAFATLYKVVTATTYQTVVADPGYFDDPPYLYANEFRFGKFYEWAHGEWAAGRTQNVPPSWRLVFTAADHRTNTTTGIELAALAAHVLGDFPEVTHEAGVAPRFKRSYDQVNPILEAAAGPANAELARRCDPRADDLDMLPVPILGELTIDGALVAMRELAWEEANTLALAQSLGTVPYAAALNTVQTEASTVVTAILAGTLDTPQGRAGHDAFCAAHKFDGVSHTG
jgi:hypothetical protein